MMRASTAGSNSLQVPDSMGPPTMCTSFHAARTSRTSLLLFTRRPQPLGSYMHAVSLRCCRVWQQCENLSPHGMSHCQVSLTPRCWLSLLQSIMEACRQEAAITAERTRLSRQVIIHWWYLICTVGCHELLHTVLSLQAGETVQTFDHHFPPKKRTYMMSSCWPLRHC